METQNQVNAPVVDKSRFSKAVAVATGVMLAGTVTAQAAAPSALEMGDATGTLVLALAAIGALGAAKIAPAALTWVWSMVTGMAKRG